MTPALELVVARCSEDIAWLRRVPRGFAVTVYDKGNPSPAGIQLPNTGREAHTYLRHLAERYETLADLTVFVQGHPFDHAPDLRRRLSALTDGRERVEDFFWLGFVADTDDARGQRLFVPWSKNADGRELRMDDFHRQLFGVSGAALYRFFPGAQFAVSRRAAHRRSAGFYRAAEELAAAFPDAAHCFERTWDRVFMADGTAGRLPPGELTAYFKPVRRLASAKDPLVPSREPR